MGEDVGKYGGSYAVSKGLLAEFGPERIRDTPLSESTFVGAGIGAALGGMRPIVEIMTVNFSLLALDQIVNNAATIRHMSGGQFSIPLVIRMATGAGRQLAAQHAHSLEGWYAHIPGIRIVTPATLEDARGMLWTALEDPDPVLIFEHQTLYNMEGTLADNAGACGYRPRGDPPRREGCEPDHLRRHAGQDAEGRRDARRRRHRCGGYRSPHLASARYAAILASVRKTHRAVIVDEGWKSGSLSAEIVARLVEHAFYDLDAPLARVCSAEVPIPYPNISRMPRCRSRPRLSPPRASSSVAMSEFRMPSLGADMEAGTLVEWLKHPGDAVKRGDIIAIVDTQKGAIEIEVFEDGVLDRTVVDAGEKVPVGTVLAMIRGAGPERAVAACLRDSPARHRQPRRFRRQPPAPADTRSCQVVCACRRSRGSWPRNSASTSRRSRAPAPGRSRAKTSNAPPQRLKQPAAPARRPTPPADRGGRHARRHRRRRWRARSARSRTTTSRRRST